MSNPSFGKGIFFAFFAYFLWGSLPLYWRLLAAISPIHLLGFRVIVSLFSVSIVLLLAKNYSWLGFFKDRKTSLIMILASLLITLNWGLYVWAVNSGNTIQTSLGYYINPLITIILGLVFFREKLKILQIIAFISAFIGVAVLTIFNGQLPWISLSLAFSFAAYSVLKKTVKLPALESLGAETLIAFPIGIMLLFTTFGMEGLEFTGPQGLYYITQLSGFTQFLILLIGLVSSLPLYLFAKGAKILPLSTLGFIQFVSPTMTFLTGLFIFRESFPVRNFIAFGFIWGAAILYIISLRLSSKQK